MKPLSKQRNRVRRPNCSTCRDRVHVGWMNPMDPNAGKCGDCLPGEEMDAWIARQSGMAL
jgi:hypothetical protein